MFNDTNYNYSHANEAVRHEALDLTFKPTQRPHIGVQSEYPIAPRPAPKTIARPTPAYCLPRLHMAGHIDTAAYSKPAMTSSDAKPAPPRVAPPCGSPPSDGVIASSSRGSQDWKKYVTGNRYSPLSGYGSGSNSAGNSPYSSTRSSPCREMMSEVSRPVVNWTHLEQVKLFQEVSYYFYYEIYIYIYINI